MVPLQLSGGPVPGCGPDFEREDSLSNAYPLCDSPPIEGQANSLLGSVATQGPFNLSTAPRIQVPAEISFSLPGVSGPLLAE